MKKPKDFIFLHIPKTAGTTFHRIIESQYPVWNTFGTRGRSPHRSLERLRGMSQGRRDRIRVLKGHMHFGLHRLLREDFTYVCFLRDPIDLGLSFYYFAKRRTDHYLHELANREGLAGFLEAMPTSELRNFSVRAVANTPYDEEVTPESLETAISNLEKHFAVVGLTERFTESLALIEAALDWRVEFLDSQNVTRSRPGKEEVSEEGLEMLREMNSLDLKLYDYALKRFETAMGEGGPALKERVAELEALAAAPPQGRLGRMGVKARSMAVRAVSDWL